MQRFLMLAAVLCTAAFVIAPTNAGEKGETKKTSTAKSTSKSTSTEKSTKKTEKKADFDVNALGEKGETKKTEKSTSKSTSTEKSTKKTEKSSNLELLGEKETKKTGATSKSTDKGTSKSTDKGTSKTSAKTAKRDDFDVNALGEKGETKKSEKSSNKSTDKSSNKSTDKSTKKTEKADRNLTPGLVLLGEKETKKSGKTEKTTGKTEKSGKTEKGTSKTEKGARLSIGDMAPSFANLPNATMPGKKMSLEDCKSDVLVVCITCNHCPVAVMYEDRMIAFAKKYKTMDKTSKVGFVAINVNNGEQDKLPKMEERVREKGFNFPYLYDESQAIAKALNATVTPEFYVFDKNRKLIYHGPLDDNNTAASAKTNLLEAAVEAGLKGELPTVTEQKARGCGVQYQTR